MIIKEINFYSFPISKTSLFFIVNKDKILYYTLAKMAEKYNCSMDEVGRNMGVTWCDFEYSCKQGEKVLRELKDCKLVFHFPREYFWDFVNNKHKKNEYDYILFRAFQALKTIVGNKPYAKLSNEYLFARMCGCCNIEEFKSKYYLNGKPRKSCVDDVGIILKYFTRKRIDNLKRDLENTYRGVKFFSPPNCRGFYVTTKEGITRETMAKLIEVDEGGKRANQKSRNEDNKKALEVWKRIKTNCSN